MTMFISGDSKLKQTVLLPAYAVTLLKQYVGFINDGALGRLIKWDWGAGKFVNQGFQRDLGPKLYVLRELFS